MMKKIMIVDDEMLVRVGIKSIVDWEKHGYRMVGEASNGEEALAIIEKQRPDIVMTDLIMSPVDGFELIERCKTMYPSVKFVVLSSYSDMDNVKKAMKLGALDYVFKLKVTAESIIGMLDEVSKSAQKQEPAPAQGPNMAVKNVPAIKQRLMQTIIEKSYVGRREIRNELQQLNVRVPFDCPYVLFYLSIDDFELKVFSDVIQEVQLLKYSVTNILEEVLNKYFECDVYGYSGGNIIAVLKQDRDYALLVSNAREAFEQNAEYMKRYLDITVSGALSSPYGTLSDVAEAVKEVTGGIKSRLYKGSGYFSVPGEWKQGAKTLRASYEGISNDLEKVINKNSDSLIQYLERFFNTVCALENVRENDVRECFFEMYHSLNKCANGYGIDVNKLTDEQGCRLYYVILKGDTLTTIRESFLTVARRFIETLSSGKKQIMRKDITEAKKYIRNNLSAHLTVSTVSEMLNMNGSYFSHLFKKETGKNFVDYVNYMRISRAKELLSTTDYRIYEIAAMVGIDSPNYFSVLFKKITGKNPNDFRQK